MPRPKKCRRICALPRCSSFGPLEGVADGRVEMAVEEYEAIRLSTWGCTQEECAAQMGVARSTVQQAKTLPAQAGPGPRREAPAHLRRRLCALAPGRKGPADQPGGIAVWDAGCGACLRSKEN